MEILDAKLIELKNIVDKHAKYQKVMLVYDNSVGNAQLLDVYNAVKGECIFNQMSVGENFEQLFDGYKLVIFVCTADGFLRCPLDLDEFVCVFMPTDNAVLPYFLNKDGCVSRAVRYLLVKPNNLDANAICSRMFNNFYNYLNNLIFLDEGQVKFDFDIDQITQSKILGMVNDAPENLVFFDILVLRACGLEYKWLGMVDYLLVTAFCCLIASLHTNNVELVDVYKAAGEDYDLVDKFYAMANNSVFKNIVQLNYRYLSAVGQKTRETILNFVDGADKKQIEFILQKIKIYSKVSGDLLNYLYLYNVFSL